MEKKEFRAESRRLLEMMIHSIYTHREIFLRELISNASDAIDKLCYLSLTDNGVGMERGDFAVTLAVDRVQRTLTVSDNGIGMDESELENNLGVIAASGSLAFRREHPQDGDTDIIGQFGVGFYSAFMVAERVEVRSKKYGSGAAFCWQSDGADGYSIAPCERAGVGTDVILHLRADEDGEDEFSRYLDEGTLRALVKKYSDYIRFPIRMAMPRTNKKDDGSFETVYEVETLNSMQPLWQRKKSEVSKDEYDAFYRQRFSELAPPQRVITVAAEGAVTYRALLFIPSAPPAYYRTEEFKPGLQLYSAGVMVMEHCDALLPEYLNFVRGVVDSPDLSLNISRELLQHDRQLRVIAANLEKKVRAELERMKKDERSEYEAFFRNFGRQIKLGILDNYGARKEELQELLLFPSTAQEGLVTLAEYADRMPEGQSAVYYAPGESVASIGRLPQSELLRERGTEILCFTDQTDEFLAGVLHDYRGHELRSVIDGEAEGEAAPEADAPQQETIAFVKEALAGRVDEVKASARLKSHPVCLSGGEGLTFEMEKYFAAVQPELGLKARRILELNTQHPAFAALERARTADPEKAKKYAEILYAQALLIAGLPLEDPTAYGDMVCSLWD